jgi:hypothetical protein
MLSNDHGTEGRKYLKKGLQFVSDGDIDNAVEAFFTRRGLNKRTILRDLYHHLVHVNGFEMSKAVEERAANSYARFSGLAFCKSLRNKEVGISPEVLTNSWLSV